MCAVRHAAMTGHWCQGEQCPQGSLAPLGVIIVVHVVLVVGMGDLKVVDEEDAEEDLEGTDVVGIRQADRGLKRKSDNEFVYLTKVTVYVIFSLNYKTLNCTPWITNHNFFFKLNIDNFNDFIYCILRTYQPVWFGMSSPCIFHPMHTMKKLFYMQIVGTNITSGKKTRLAFHHTANKLNVKVPCSENVTVSVFCT